MFEKKFSILCLFIFQMFPVFDSGFPIKVVCLKGVAAMPS